MTILSEELNTLFNVIRLRTKGISILKDAKTLSFSYFTMFGQIKKCLQ